MDSAIYSAKQLWDSENAYLRYRLSVILVEDIGIANISLLTKALEGKLGKRWIDARGGFEWLSNEVIAPAVESPKDRTACDLGMVSKNELSTFTKKYGSFETISISDAEKIFFSESDDLCIKGLAAWRICGTDIYPHDTLPLVKGDWQRWLDINKTLGVSDEVLNIMTLGQKTQREWHPIYLGVLSLLNKDVKITYNKLENLKCGDILASACDMHTKIGKISISNFIRKTPALYNEIKKQNQHLAFNDVCYYVGKLLFLIEGGLLDQQYTYTRAIEVNKINKTQWQINSGLDGNKIASIIWQNRNVLLDCRSTQVQSLTSGGYDVLEI